MKNTIVISAYPCCGKTYAYKHYADKYSIIDSDSSLFSWTYDINNKIGKSRNLSFPNNYIESIKNSIGNVDFILVSSHLEVRQALQDAGIDYVTVYPEENLLAEWIGRMYLRGDTKSFIDKQIKMWKTNMENIKNEPYGKKLYRLCSNEYLDLDAMMEQLNITCPTCGSHEYKELYTTYNIIHHYECKDCHKFFTITE